MALDWFEDAGLAIDFRSCRVWLDDSEVSVSALRFRILSCLVENAGRPVTTRQLIRYAWETPEYDTSLVKWHIARLRRELGDIPPRRIVHIRGFGYRYDPQEGRQDAPSRTSDAPAVGLGGYPGLGASMSMPLARADSMPVNSLRCQQVYR